MASPVILQPAFFSLILIAVHVSVLVDCRPRLRDPEQRLQRQQSSFHTGAHADTSAGMGRFFLELSGSEKRGIHRDFLEINGMHYICAENVFVHTDESLDILNDESLNDLANIYTYTYSYSRHILHTIYTKQRDLWQQVVLPDRSNFVSMFDLRRKWFICVDLKGELYNSKQRDKRDCLFQRIWLDPMNYQDVFYSTSGGQLLKLKGAEVQTAHQKSPEPSLALLYPLVKRQRRSEEVNPSDPLRSQSHPSYFAKDYKHTSHGQPEQDKAGAVSKETITSCDDPLRVLQANGPVSPIKTNMAEWAEHD